MGSAQVGWSLISSRSRPVSLVPPLVLLVVELVRSQLVLDAAEEVISEK